MKKLILTSLVSLMCLPALANTYVPYSALLSTETKGFATEAAALEAGRLIESNLSFDKIAVQQAKARCSVSSDPGANPEFKNLTLSPNAIQIEKYYTTKGEVYTAVVSYYVDCQVYKSLSH